MMNQKVKLRRSIFYPKINNTGPLPKYIKIFIFIKIK